VQAFSTLICSLGAIGSGALYCGAGWLWRYLSLPDAVVGQVNTSRLDVTASPTAKPATGKCQSCPPPTLNFDDQSAFRSTGSTTAALIFILHSVTRLLTTQPYVVVIALDFSKAFDNVCHRTLLDKMADLDIPDDVYNWLVSHFSGHSHCTRYGGGVVGPPRNFGWDNPGVEHRPDQLRR